MDNRTRSALRTTVMVVTLLALAGSALAGAGAVDTAEGDGNYSDGGEDLLDALAADSPTASAGDVNVTLTPSESVVPPGEQQAYDVVVHGTTDGISAYELNLSVADPAIGEFVEYEPANEPFLYNATISADGSGLAAMVALGDNKHDPGETVVIATVTVEASTEGTASTAIDVADAAVMDNENIFYSVAGVENATFAVNPDAVSIEPRPAGDEWLVGSPLPVEVAVEHPNDGISEFTLTLELDGNGTVLDYDLPRGGVDDTEIADNGSLIVIDVALEEPYEPADERVVAEVTVVGDGPGELGTGLTGAAVTDLEGDLYVNGFGSGDTTLIEGPPPLPGFDERPTDPTGDLLAEDVDGDGAFDIFDVQALFTNLDSQPVQEYAWAFDFDEDGSTDIFDVQALFSMLSEA